MPKGDVPDFIKNRVDLKFSTLKTISSLIETLNSNEIEGLTVKDDLELCILTSFGMIIGDISDKNNDNPNTSSSEKFTDLVLNEVFDVRNSILASLEKDKEDLTIINNYASILLKNVKIIPYNNPGNCLNFADFILFTDEIKGITFGSASFQPQD